MVKNISKLWLNIVPNIDSFFADIMQCITEGLNCIKSFERWSRHHDMTPYVSVLEEWDDRVGDDFEIPNSVYLDPQQQIQSSP